MARTNWQKIKLVKLLELLYRETDEDHPLNTYQICDALKSIGIPCDRRILAQDVGLLNAAGIEIGSCQMSKKKGYFVKNRIFMDKELETLINVIQLADSLSDDMKNNLIEKVAELGGSHKAKQLMPEPGPQKRKITLEFDLTLYPDVFEWFLLVEMVSFSEDKAVLTVESLVDEKFWNWIVSFDENVKVISPEEVAMEYRKRLTNRINMNLIRPD